MQRRAPLFPFASYPLLFAHRGCSGIAPENTLAAFGKVRELSIPGVELDVQLARTGELVVFHDSNLKRITGTDALLTETDFAALRELDAGGWFGPEFAGESIPLLDEVIDLLGDSVYYDIEIKHWNRMGGALEQSVVETIRRRGLQERALVSSFNPYAVRAVRRLDARLPTALIYTKYHEFPWYLSRGAGRFLCDPHILKPNRHRLNRWSIFWKKQLWGYPLVTWTEDDPAEVARYLQMGVDGVISNVPEQMLPLFEARWRA